MTKNQPNSVSQKSLYLKQVRIRNYAPLINAKVSFQRGLNIIIGPNGTGKTRFVELASQLVGNIEDVTYLGAGCEVVFGFLKDIIVRFKQPISIEQTEVTNSRILPIHDFGLDVYASYNGQESTADSLELALGDVGIAFHLVPETVVAKYGSPLQGIPLVDIPATITVQAKNGQGKVEPAIGRFNRVGKTHLSDTIFNIALFALLWPFRRRQQPAPTALTSEAVQAEVKRVINAFLFFINPSICLYSPISQIRISPGYQVYDHAAQQEIILKGLEFEYLLGESWLPFSALSDGTKRMLYLISQLVMPSISFGGQQPAPLPFSFTTPSRTIFLEEPELGIHPDQLQKLLSLIREVSKEHQVIMTTHSPQVLNMLTTKELDRITICELDPEKGTQFRKLSPAKRAKAKAYMQNDSYLSDFWLYSNLEAE